MSDQEETSVSDQEETQEFSSKNTIHAFYIWVFIGVVGAHRFYLGRWKTGLAMLVLTLSVYGSPVSFCWWMYDLYLLLTAKLTDANEMPMRSWIDTRNNAGTTLREATATFRSDAAAIREKHKLDMVEADKVDRLRVTKIQQKVNGALPPWMAKTVLGLLGSGFSIPHDAEGNVVDVPYERKKQVGILAILGRSAGIALLVTVLYGVVNGWEGVLPSQVWFPAFVIISIAYALKNSQSKTDDYNNKIDS